MQTNFIVANFKPPHNEMGHQKIIVSLYSAGTQIPVYTEIKRITNKEKKLRKSILHFFFWSIQIQQAEKFQH